MIDKEAIGMIADAIRNSMALGFDITDPEIVAKVLLAQMRELGYRKPPEGEQGLVLTPEDCPLCGGSGEILRSKIRMMGYTLADGETVDEELIPCPLCEYIQAQLAHAEPLIRKDERERITKDIATTLDFAVKVASAMNELRSSQVFFILQQAWGDIDWEEAQDILNTVIAQIQALKECNE